MKHRQRGFTLIELLVVIAIIGILASVVLSSLESARASARDSQRVQMAKQLQISLEMYRNANGGYPSTGGHGSWRGGPAGCFGGHGFGATGYIPGLVPNYISTLPSDPGGGCFLYTSNGTDYKILIHGTFENCVAGSCPLQDPARLSQRTGTVYSSQTSRMW